MDNIGKMKTPYLKGVSVFLRGLGNSEAVPENPRVGSSSLSLGTTQRLNNKEAFSGFHWKLFLLEF